MQNAAVVPLGVLACRVAESAYADSQALVETARGRTEAERQQMLGMHLAAVRQRLLRLLVLSRWSGMPAQSMVLCGKVHDALLQRDAAFSDAAARLFEAHCTQAVEPLYATHAALDVVARQGRHQLPLSLAGLAQPRQPEGAAEERLSRLDAALHMALMRAERPPELSFAIRGGKATLTVPGHFKALATLRPLPQAPPAAPSPPALQTAPEPAGDEAKPQGSSLSGCGWTVLEAQILVAARGESTAVARCDLPAQQQMRLCWELNQRLVRARPREIASSKPLMVLCDLLSDVAATVALDVAVRQAKRLQDGRWGVGRLRLDPILPSPTMEAPAGVVLCYWLNSWDWVSQGENRGLGEPAQQRFYRRCQIYLDDNRQLRCLHTPSLEAAGLQLDASLLDVEALLHRTIRAASIDVLASVRAELQSGSLTGSGFGCEMVADDGVAPRLELRMLGQLDALPAVCLVVDQRSGALRVVPTVGSTSSAYDVPGALECNAELEKGRLLKPLQMLWRQMTSEYISNLAALIGFEPLGPKAGTALRGPDGQILDITLRVAPRLLIGIIIGDTGGSLARSTIFMFSGGNSPTQVKPSAINHQKSDWRSALSELVASASRYKPREDRQLDLAAIALILGSEDHY